jgi:uncharacterized protein (PEP-CTERM system associated)
MRSRTATGLLGNAKRYLPVAFATMLAAGAQLSTDVIADVFRLQPTLILQQIFTDNIRASSSDRDADGITSLTARLNAALTTDHIEAAARVEATYNEVWAANDLDGFAGRGDAVTRVRLYENILEVDGVARRQQVFLQPSGSGIDFLTGIGQRQETDYAVSPLLNLEVLGLADLAVRATYAQVLFDDPVAGPSPIPLDDITLKEISGRIGTGQRASAYELIASADYLETDTDFQRRNIVGSVFLNLTDKFTAIGRVGYERITDPSIAPVRGPLWSAGGRLNLGKNSSVQVEYGRRYGYSNSTNNLDDVTWLVDFDVEVTPKLNMSGSYTDTFVPVQLTYYQSLDEIFDSDTVLDISTPKQPGIFDPTVVDQIIRSKNALLTATYQVDLRTYELTVRQSERLFLTSQQSEDIFGFRLAVDERLSRKLSYVAGLNFFKTTRPLVADSGSDDYALDLAVRYQLGLNTRLTGGYLWRLRAGDNDVDTYENVLRFGVERAF